MASDMLEMGDQAQASHRRLGEKLSEVPWSGVIYLGTWGKEVQGAFPDNLPFCSLPEFHKDEV